MVRPPLTHCKRGHAFDTKNTALVCDAKGYIHRRCRRCHVAYNSAAAKLRYRHDTAFRKARAASSLAYYHTHKALKRSRPNASV